MALLIKESRKICANLLKAYLLLMRETVLVMKVDNNNDSFNYFNI